MALKFIEYFSYILTSIPHPDTKFQTKRTINGSWGAQRDILDPLGLQAIE
jgi:hypothetical protein